MKLVSLLATALVLALGGQGMALAQETTTGPGEPVSWAHDDPMLEWGECPDFLPEGCALVVLGGDPAGDNADLFFRVPAGASIPRHLHTAAERMTLVSGNMRLTYDGHDTLDLKPGMYVYGPAGLPHEGECTRGDDCVLFIAFDGPVDAIEVDAEASGDGS